MKQWMRVLMALVLAACAVVVYSVVATPKAHATGQTLYEDCQTYFVDGPNAGKTETVQFLISSGGALTVYSSDYTAPGQGSWFSNGSNSYGYAFTASLAAIPGSTLSVNQTFPANTYPVVSSGTGTITDSSGHQLMVVHTTGTCAYFIPSTAPCAITYAMSQWAGGFTATITITNTTSTNLAAGATLFFVFPGSQTVTSGWGGNYSQSGNTVTLSALGAISAGGSVSPGFNGNWSGSNPTPQKYTLTMSGNKPCALNV